MAIDFDGTDDILNYGSPSHLDDLSNWTYCAWVRPDTLGELTFGTIMRKSASGPGRTMNNEGTNQLRGAASRATTNMNIYSANNTMVMGSWQFVAWTYDGTTGKLFHGSPGGACAEVSYGSNTQGTGAMSSDASASLTVGNETGGATTYDGRIAYARIFNVALTANELTGVMYNAPVRRDACVFDAWLDTTTGVDRSGNAVVPTVTGSPVLADNPPIPPPFMGDNDDFLAWLVSSGVSGTIAVTLANLTSSISASRTHSGTIAVTLANQTSAISGTKTIRGTIAQTLDTFTSAIAAAKSHIGTMAVTLDTFISSITGSKSHTGTIAVTLATFVSAISGTAGGAISRGRWFVRMLANKFQFGVANLRASMKRNRNNQ